MITLINNLENVIANYEESEQSKAFLNKFSVFQIQLGDLEKFTISSCIKVGNSVTST